VLARLDEVSGVRESRVDWTGRLLLLAVERDANADEVADRATDALGGAAHRADPEVEARAIETFRAGEPWLRSGEALRLSEEEARVVGARLGARASAAAGLDAEATRRFSEIVQDELRLAFQALHDAAPDTPRDSAQETAFRLGRVRERCGAFLDDALADRACEELLRAFRGDE